jgi:Domain of unknown function (DUF4263)
VQSRQGIMKEIETRSTSRNTAESDPIVLRETDLVRLAFLPVLVTNSANSQACVRGHFVYQRKTKKAEWASVADVPLSTLKGGEGYKLELHSAEVLKLLKELGALYRLYQQHGIPRGRIKYVQLREELARFLELGEQDLTTLLESDKEGAETTLLKLLKWLATSPSRNKAVATLAATAPEQLPGLSAALGLAVVKDAMKYWKQNQENRSEEFWQQALTTRTYVLSQIFAYPVVVICKKAYVGGKQVTNRGGNIVDFLASIESTGAVVLIEIKTPQTNLLGPEYRDGVFPLSGDLSGAVAQVLRYRQSLMHDFHSVTANCQTPLTLGEPRCVVVAGHAENELTSGSKRESFELQRERLQGVTIITYDELFHRLGRIVTLLEGEDHQ